MGTVARRLRNGRAILLGCALAALWVTPANASETHILTADTFHLSGDIRLVGVDGEKSWVDGGFGKLRSGSDGEFQVQPQLGNATLVWQPQLTWSIGATISGSVQGGQRTQAGMQEAYLSFRPMRSSAGLAVSARAGLMWPPVSLEHEGADWHVRDSITPSAINSWIGEEVRPVAVEAALNATLGEHKLRATAALIAANDTSGTLLTFRGWALHDRTTLAFNRQPLPPLGDFAGLQAPYTHPLIDLHQSFAHRPGYYVKLSWQPPAPIRVELFRYDNRANPQHVRPELEWGWDTDFDQVALVADLGSQTMFKAQALQGRTRMGYMTDGRRWIDNRFRSAFALLTRQLGKVGLSARADLFDTRQRGSLWGEEYDQRGWSAMVAAKREWAHVTGLVELLHVWSDSPMREHAAEEPRERQTQLQAQVRMHW